MSTQVIGQMTKQLTAQSERLDDRNRIVPVRG